MNSGPLSERIYAGVPRSPKRPERHSRTCFDCSRLATTIARHSREKGEGDDYTTRVKSLKQRFPNVDPSYFDTLVAVKDATSEKVHEKSYDAWQSKHLRLIFSALKEVLDEIYVIPKIREKRQQEVGELRNTVLGPSDT